MTKTRRFRPQVEVLEDRLVPSLYRWVGPGTFATPRPWQDPDNWICVDQPGTVPGSPGYEDADVIIPAIGAATGEAPTFPLIEYVETFTIRSLRSENQISDLSFPAEIRLNGALNIVGGVSHWNGKSIHSVLPSANGRLTISGGTFNWSRGEIRLSELRVMNDGTFSALENAEKYLVHSTVIGYEDTAARFNVGAPAPEGGGADYGLANHLFVNGSFYVDVHGALDFREETDPLNSGGFAWNPGSAYAGAEIFTARDGGSRGVVRRDADSVVPVRCDLPLSNEGLLEVGADNGLQFAGTQLPSSTFAIRGQGGLIKLHANSSLSVSIYGLLLDYGSELIAVSPLEPDFAVMFLTGNVTCRGGIITVGTSIPVDGYATLTINGSLTFEGAYVSRVRTHIDAWAQGNADFLVVSHDFTVSPTAAGVICDCETLGGPPAGPPPQVGWTYVVVHIHGLRSGTFSGYEWHGIAYQVNWITVADIIFFELYYGGP